mgnify:CR=1 FL=1
MTAAPETVEAVIEAIALVTRCPRGCAESSLAADLAFDALDRMALACELDEAFEIDLPDADVAEWESVADVALSIDRLTREKSA